MKHIKLSILSLISVGVTMVSCSQHVIHFMEVNKRKPTIEGSTNEHTSINYRNDNNIMSYNLSDHDIKYDEVLHKGCKDIIQDNSLSIEQKKEALTKLRQGIFQNANFHHDSYAAGYNNIGSTPKGSNSLKRILPKCERRWYNFYRLARWITHPCAGIFMLSTISFIIAIADIALSTTRHNIPHILIDGVWGSVIANMTLGLICFFCSEYMILSININNKKKIDYYEKIRLVDFHYTSLQQQEQEQEQEQKQKQTYCNEGQPS